MSQEFKKLTRGTKDIIKKAIQETNTTNRHELCENICATLEDRFSGETLSYQLQRMNLETTGDVLSAIDTYMFKHSKESDFNDKNSEQE